MAANGDLSQDHEDQMQLGIRIITSAFQNKMHSLEQEIRTLRLTAEDQRQNVSGLQKKNSTLEGELVDIHQRSQMLAEENKELFKTVGSLRKQIGRLEHLKQAVLSSIQDDQAQEAVDGDSRALMSDEFLRGAAPHAAEAMARDAMGFAAAGNTTRSLTGLPQQQLQPQAQPLPQQHGAISPPQTQPAMYDQAPAAAGSPVIDGKQFFRQARSRLSYEAFNLFLASIKRLNNMQQSRDETLEEARRIFGSELGDLYNDFENLLSRQAM